MTIHLSYQENMQAINVLHTSIRNNISIPMELQRNLYFSTTALGGLFLNFRSNMSSELAMQNSRVKVTMYFDTTDGRGRYVGDNIGLSISRKSNIQPPRGINKKVHYLEVTKRINNWISKNKQFLIDSIEG